MIMNGEVGAPLKSLGLAGFGINNSFHSPYLFLVSVCRGSVELTHFTYWVALSFGGANRDDLRFLSTWTYIQYESV